MQQESQPQMNQSPLGRITPWVGRILAINAVVMLLQQTLFTSDTITETLLFDPSSAIQRPWTFFTYMMLHGSLFHLLGNSLALYAFGPAVESRLGSRRFVLYYIYCGVGAALVSLVVSSLLPVYPFVGASGAVLGVALAFAHFFPQAELVIFPIPVPIKARTLIMVIIAIDVVGMALGSDNIAHTAHLGGMAFGWLFFASQRWLSGDESPRLPPMRPRVTVPVGRIDGSGRQPAPKSRAEARPTAPPVPDAAKQEQAETDRLLDKIGASGIGSLTAAERQFLDTVSRRRRDQVN
jgi:membrane associated rhomboid family serine protease